VAVFGVILCFSANKHRLTVDDCQRMSDRQRDKARDQCFRLTAPTGTVTSPDGSVTVRVVQHCGHKPHQRKRPTAERSTTLVKHSKADFLPDDDDDLSDDDAYLVQICTVHSG